MIEWAKAGREILASKTGFSRGRAERQAMAAQIEAADLAGRAFQRIETLRVAALPKTAEPVPVNPAFAKLFPDYADKGFSGDLQTVLVRSREEALHFKHNYIGTEHLLLGLLHGGNPAEPVMKEMGVTIEKARNAVEFIIGYGERPLIGRMGLTPRSKKTLDLTIDEARQLKDSQVNSYHLLLGIAREGEGIAAGVLESCGVYLDKIKQTAGFYF